MRVPLLKLARPRIGREGRRPAGRRRAGTVKYRISGLQRRRRRARRQRLVGDVREDDEPVAAVALDELAQRLADAAERVGRDARREVEHDRCRRSAPGSDCAVLQVRMPRRRAPPRARARPARRPGPARTSAVRSRDRREGTGAGNRDGVHLRACRPAPRRGRRARPCRQASGAAPTTPHRRRRARAPARPGGDRLGEQLERPAPVMRVRPPRPSHGRRRWPGRAARRARAAAHAGAAAAPGRRGPRPRGRRARRRRSGARRRGPGRRRRPAGRGCRVPEAGRAAEIGRRETGVDCAAPARPPTP